MKIEQCCVSDIASRTSSGRYQLMETMFCVLFVLSSNSPVDQGSYIIGFILYVAYVIPRILQKFQTEGWHVVVDASCAPYWDLIQHLQSCAEKVCWGTHTLVELRSGSSCPPCFDVKMAEFGEAQNPGPSSSSSSGVLQPTPY